MKLPEDIFLFSRVSAAGAEHVVLCIDEPPLVRLNRWLTPPEALELARALVNHAADPITARAVSGLLGGVA